MIAEPYPFLFTPVFVPSPQAGGLFLDYAADSYGQLEQSPAEAWLLFDDGARSSVVVNGPLAGMSLSELFKRFGDDLTGRDTSVDGSFPLFARLLDVGTTQPIQVHPDADPAASGTAPETNAKFWYSIDREPGARITIGISRQVTNQQILLHLNRPGFERLLQRYPARPGDSYLVPPGFVHSISAGNLILEIQQRLIDPLLLAPVAEGGTNVSHEEQQRALASINREARRNVRVSREAGTATHTRRIALTPNCPYFQIEEIRLHDHIFLRTRRESFHLIYAVRGSVTVRWEDLALELTNGMLCCIPATCGDYTIVCGDTPSELLKIMPGPITP